MSDGGSGPEVLPQDGGSSMASVGTAPDSPRLLQLTEDVQRSGAAPLDIFWAEVGAEGAPLVESVDGEPMDRSVSFLWRDPGAAEAVTLVGGFATNDSETHLVRLPGTDVWYRSCRVPVDARATYVFSPNDPGALGLPVRTWAERTATWAPDPFNPRQWQYPCDSDRAVPDGDPRRLGITWSRVDLPEAPPTSWSVPAEPERAGRLRQYRLGGSSLSPCTWLPEPLQKTRRVWVYTPAGYAPASGCQALVLFLDGWDYLNLIPTPTILDNLIAAGRIPPVVAVFLDNPVLLRDEELSCNPALTDFIATTLLPWVCREFHVGAQPHQRLIAGLSLGALAAAHVAVTRPGLFGGVLSQSGSFWWKPLNAPEFEWFTAHAAAVDVDARFHLSVGRFETWAPVADGAPTLLMANRHLRDVLKAKGQLAGYTEFSGGHQWVCWEAVLPEELSCLLGG